MRWLLLLLFLGLAGAATKKGCRVQEVYAIGYTVHNPVERHKAMQDWLIRNARQCQSSDYVVLWNSLAEWAGSSDSVLLRNAVAQGYEDAIAREKK
jgi:hypothetical protein